MFCFWNARRRQLSLITTLLLCVPEIVSAEFDNSSLIQFAQFGGGGSGGGSSGGGGFGGGSSGGGGFGGGTSGGGGGISGGVGDGSSASGGFNTGFGSGANGNGNNTTSLGNLLPSGSDATILPNIGQDLLYLEEYWTNQGITQSNINNYDFEGGFEIDLPVAIWQPPVPLDPDAHCGPTAVCGGTGAGPITPRGGKSGGSSNGGSGAEVNVVAGMGFGASSDDSGSYASRVNRFSFPTTVALQYDGGRVLCSGTLVSERQILTAAHCVCGVSPLNAFFGETLVRDGTLLPGIRTSLSLSSHVEFFDKGFCVDYGRDKQAAMRAKVDLALVELAESLPRDLRELILPVEPISGISAGTAKLGKLYAVGFGESDNKWWPGSKNYAEIDFISRKCSATDESVNGCKADLESMAGRQPADTCYADSGGGLHVQETSGGPMILVGVTSRSMTEDILCGAGGIYTSLENEAVLNWLSELIE